MGKSGASNPAVMAADDGLLRYLRRGLADFSPAAWMFSLAALVFAIAVAAGFGFYLARYGSPPRLSLYVLEDGERYFRKGDTARALQEFAAAAAVAPADTQNQVNLGAAAYAAGDRVRAMQAFRQALRYDSDQPEASYYLGVMYLQDGRVDEAIALISRSLPGRSGAAAATAYNDLGVAYARKGDLARAADSYQRALEIDPGLDAARRNLDLRSTPDESSGCGAMSSVRQQLVGNSFVHPAFDYLLIGSLWTIVLTAYWALKPAAAEVVNELPLPWLILFANSAHFAASTVRLYSKPAYYREFRFLAFGFPAVTLAVLTVCVFLPGEAGRYLQVIYLTWAPFHYAKQVYGLSLMYSFRSGLRLGDGEKRLIYWTAMLPFGYAVFSGSPHMGVGWLLSPEFVSANPLLLDGLQAIKQVLRILVYVVPALLFVQLWRSKSAPPPLMVVALLLSNGLWWTALSFRDAFVVATIGHSVQYMAIMLIYHVREQLREPGNTRGWLSHAAAFYGKSLILGYLLFNCWPWVFVLAGAGYAESMMMVVAVINLHHFIVDAYIWRLRVPQNQKALADQPVAA